MIGSSTFTLTIGEIVAADDRAAAVFQRHGIDFCCQGARTLERGCRDAGVDTAEVMRELEAATATASHMMKEEQILFPHIVRIANAAAAGQTAPTAPFGSVDHPIKMMEQEHESAGHALLEIRELTSGFTVPDDACATYAVCLQELEAFERDLHAHVHLENNILFPKASALEASCS